MNKQLIRQFLINALDDEEGINERAYSDLVDLAQDENNGVDDIYNAVKSADGRYYLPENHEIKP